MDSEDTTTEQHTCVNRIRTENPLQDLLVPYHRLFFAYVGEVEFVPHFSGGNKTSISIFGANGWMDGECVDEWVEEQES